MKPKRALETLKIERYGHGGGRIYFDDGESRELVADTYHEADRELIYDAIKASLDKAAPAQEQGEDNSEVCWKCDGRGKLRHNRMKDGKYVLGFDTCDECGGSGALLARKPDHYPDAGEMVEERGPEVGDIVIHEGEARLWDETDELLQYDYAHTPIVLMRRAEVEARLKSC